MVAIAFNLPNKTHAMDWSSAMEISKEEQIKQLKRNYKELDWQSKYATNGTDIFYVASHYYGRQLIKIFVWKTIKKWKAGITIGHSNDWLTIADSIESASQAVDRAFMRLDRLIINLSQFIADAKTKTEIHQTSGTVSRDRYRRRDGASVRASPP